MGREGDAAELLDLVRSAEQGAYVATTPSGNPLVVPPAEEEFVDVQDEAIEATPTLPHAIPVQSHVLAAARAAEAPARGTPPVVAIVGVVAIASVVLALVAR